MEKIPVNRYVKRMGDLKTNKQTNKPYVTFLQRFGY